MIVGTPWRMIVFVTGCTRIWALSGHLFDADEDFHSAFLSLGAAASAAQSGRLSGVISQSA